MFAQRLMLVTDLQQTRVSVRSSTLEVFFLTMSHEHSTEGRSLQQSAAVDAYNAQSWLLTEGCAAAVRTRDGHTGPRPAGAIGFATLRGGSVVGEHTVVFAGPAERIELTHRAESRDIFARGALRAALWAYPRKPGLYSMMDVLDLGPGSSGG